MDTPKIPVLVLFGPTASGKTDVLFEMCASSIKPQIEVISADSMQVYRGMDIGTAKPTPEERAVLPHHLIDICDPKEQFNAGDFVGLAVKAIKETASRGNLPVVSGGTGFYLKNLIMGLSEAPPSDPEIRDQLKTELAEKGASALMEELTKADPESASRIHINDEYRLLRALEVYRVSGQPLSSFKAPTLSSSLVPLLNTSTSQHLSTFNFMVIGLTCPREELYNRINIRCEQMFSQGLFFEVRSLFKKGYTPNDPGMRAIGYREFFVKDENDNWQLSEDLKGVQSLVAQNSRRYAKRQITFFKGIPDVKWVLSNKNAAAIIKRELSLF